MHLIQVTDRKEGRLPDFEKVKPYLAQQFSMDLEKKIITDERKTAKIEVQADAQGPIRLRAGRGRGSRGTGGRRRPAPLLPSSDRPGEVYRSERSSRP